MGLTIHYGLSTVGDETHARKLVEQLRQAALDLPVKRVGDLATLRGDEGDFWETRSLERLTQEIGEQSAMLAGFLGALKDALGQAGGADALKAPIAGYPNFERLEAEGQSLLPAQVKSLLKELARSRLLQKPGG